MPSFDLGILTGQTIMFNLFFVPELMAIVAGILAFILAASPAIRPMNRQHILGWTTLMIAGAAMVVALRETPYAVPALGLLVAGALVGWAVRAIQPLRNCWLLAGPIIALTIGAIIFASGHYGRNNCWP